MNNILPVIPGVSLEVYKQDRRLIPEKDGYVGQLSSGFATILAVTDPQSDRTIGLFRNGNDDYILQKDWLNNPRTEVQKQGHQMYLASRKFQPDTRVYGIRMPLHVDEDRAVNMVNYPENMLMLAQYNCSDKLPRRDHILVWKIALVSQYGEFFLTVQKTYEVQLYEGEKEKLFIPRLSKHERLEQLLIAHAPTDLQRFPLSQYKRAEAPSSDGLKSNEGIVERWYAARNVGTVITSRGPARVHWSEVPARPRRHFLEDGERVRFTSLGTPLVNPKTAWRPMRKARFPHQVFGVELC